MLEKDTPPDRGSVRCRQLLLRHYEVWGGPREQAPISVDQPILLAGTMRHHCPVGRRKAVGCSFSASPARKHGNWQPFLDYRQTILGAGSWPAQSTPPRQYPECRATSEGSKVERVPLADELGTTLVAHHRSKVRQIDRRWPPAAPEPEYCRSGFWAERRLISNTLSTNSVRTHRSDEVTLQTARRAHRDWHQTFGTADIRLSRALLGMASPRAPIAPGLSPTSRRDF